MGAAFVQENRHAQQVRIFPDGRLQGFLVKKFSVGWIDRDDHLGAGVGHFRGGIERIFVVAHIHPVPGFRRLIMAGVNIHALRHDKGREQANAELSDGGHITMGTLFQLRCHGARAGSTDGGQKFLDHMFGHAQSIIGKGDGPTRLVEGHMDTPRMIRRLHAPQLNAVVRVLDQFAHKNVGFGVEVFREQRHEAAKVGFHFWHGILRD